MGREEVQGRKYPMWIERWLLISAIVVFVMYAGTVSQTVGHPIVGPFVGYVVFPLVLIAVVELLGRGLQALHGSKL